MTLGIVLRMIKEHTLFVLRTVTSVSLIFMNKRAEESDWNVDTEIRKGSCAKCREGCGGSCCREMMWRRRWEEKEVRTRLRLDTRRPVLQRRSSRRAHCKQPSYTGRSRAETRTNPFSATAKLYRVRRNYPSRAITFQRLGVIKRACWGFLKYFLT